MQSRGQEISGGRDAEVVPVGFVTVFLGVAGSVTSKAYIGGVAEDGWGAVASELRRLAGRVEAGNFSGT